MSKPAFVAPTFTARTSKGQAFPVTMTSEGKLLISGYAAIYAIQQGRACLHLDAATVKALVGVSVERGAYLALDRAITAADQAAARAAAPTATEEDVFCATAFATAAATGRRVALGHAGQRGSIGNTCDVTTYAMPDGSQKEFAAGHE